MFRILLTAASFIIGASAIAAELKLDGENTKVEFTGTKTNGKHSGGFKIVKGTANAEGGDLTKLKIELEIDVASLYSDDEKLTGHLKSPDFFNVKEYPKAQFATTKVTKGDKGYEIVGELTLLGKKQEVKFTAETSLAGEALKLKSEFKIDRTKWGMTYGKGKIDDLVTLKVEVETKK
jgi:polyisoprenoid-binding protein YceI